MLLGFDTLEKIHNEHTYGLRCKLLIHVSCIRRNGSGEMAHALASILITVACVYVCVRVCACVLVYVCVLETFEIIFTCFLELPD